MRIVDVREQAISLRSAISNAWVSFEEMDTSVVAVVSDVMRAGKPLVGFGFNSNGRYAADAIIRRRLVPRLLHAPPEALLGDDGANFDPGRIWEILMRNEKPGGHGERAVAVAALDMAIYDLVAKIEEKPLYRYLADRYRNGVADEDVFVYAAGGYYYPGKGLAELQDEARRYLDLGYTVLKMKIGGAPLDEDLRRVEAFAEVVGDSTRVAVDANGRFDLATALAYGKALEPYDLFWYEEPGDPLDFELHARLAEAYEPALATGENLFSHQDARNLMRYAGFRPDRDVFQLDPALSYGLTEYLRVLAAIGDYGVSPRRCIPHGGHQFALHIAAGLGLGGNESYPGVFEPIGGFADGIPVVDGRVHPGDAPGLGIEEKAPLHRVMRELVA